jgi:hypothetical protein
MVPKQFWFLFMAWAAAAQDSPFSQKPKPEAEPAKKEPADGPPRSMPYSENYEKALGFIKSNFGGKDWRTVPDLFCGLVFLLDGREELAVPLARAIAIAKKKVLDDKSFNGNWFVAYSALFLAIVYSHEKLDDVKAALEEGFKVAMRTRETDTLGWGHNKGWGRSSGYYKRGGAVDLGIVTATMLSAALIARENGVEVPRALIDGAFQNLHSIARGGVVAYGTNNGVLKNISRSSAAFAGMHIAKSTSSPIYSAVVQQLPRDGAGTENGHAYGPIHFFANAVAAQLMGNYPSFSNHWLPILTSRQKADGSTSMGNDGRKGGSPELGATAVYALMILMQKQKLIPPAQKGPRLAPGAKGGSPFSQKRPKIDDNDLPTSEPPKAPVTGSGQE